MKIRGLREFLYKRLILMVIIPMFIIALTAINISVGSIREMREGRDSAVENIIDHFLRHTEYELDQAGEIFLMLEESIDRNSYLDALVKNHIEFKKVQILNLDGIVVDSSGGDNDTGMDMSNFDFFKESLGKAAATWSKGELFSPENQYEIIVAKKYGDYIFLGYIDSDVVNSELKKIVGPNKGKISVLDSKGNTVFYNYDIPLEIQNIIRYEYLTAHSGEKSSELNFVTERGMGRVTGSYRKISGTEWIVVFLENQGRITTLIWDFRNDLVFVLVFFMLIMVYSVYSVIQRILSDVRNLRRISRKILDRDLPERRSYKMIEIKELADRFFEMGKTMIERERSTEERALFFQNLIDTIPNPVFYLDGDNVYLGCNDAFSKSTGIKKEEILGKPLYDIMLLEEAEFYSESNIEIFKAGGSAVTNRKRKDSAGKTRYFKIYKSVFKDVYGEKAGIIGTVIDVTELKEAVKESEKSRRLVDKLIYAVPLPIFYKERDGVYLNCNRAFGELVGKSRDEIIGSTHDEIWGKDFAEKFEKNDLDILESSSVQKFEYKFKDKDEVEKTIVVNKTAFYREDGEIAGVIGVISDVTEFKIIEDKLKNLSMKDSLTDIYNRRGFEEFTGLKWKEAAQYKKDIAIIMVDIDDFKSYNDHYGHQAGDECLRRVAEVIKDSCRRPSDVVARYGGEEFIIFLFDTDIRGGKTVAELIRKRVEALNIEHVKSENQRVTVSLGLAKDMPTSLGDIEKLISKADQRLYKAKKKGKNTVVA